MPATLISFPRLMAAALLTLPMAFAAPANAQDMTKLQDMPAGVYQVDKTHASLIWNVSHAGLSNYTARFKAFDASVTLDPKDVTKSKIVATIDPRQIETDYTGERDFNNELATGDQWFNAAKFPTMTFTSTSLEKTGETTGKMHGNLTMLGVTKPVTLDVTFNGAFAEQPFSKKPTLGFSAIGELERSAWGLSTYVPMIGDKVTFRIEAEFNMDAAKTDTKSDTAKAKK